MGKDKTNVKLDFGGDKASCIDCGAVVTDNVHTMVLEKRKSRRDYARIGIVLCGSCWQLRFEAIVQHGVDQMTEQQRKALDNVLKYLSRRGRMIE